MRHDQSSLRLAVIYCGHRGLTTWNGADGVTRERYRGLDLVDVGYRKTLVGNVVSSLLECLKYFGYDRYCANGGNS